MAKKVFADGEVKGEEAAVLRKICIGVGFSIDNIEKVACEAINFILNNNDLEDFTKAINL